ncbi:MAG: AsnC family transcriptional regulator [Gammaproteobacteria bacterium]|nr:AsnC family transcriptional regulator [Gammaproteobacteria bacterium]MCW8840848.1 AsnC family transcriptional regulator [Gammaproteobacteria bacterium]MCW8927900.1 AsnC family transcriptional regulator [Gammaproteobacteria bacterium]MCW8958402.1 AsnC family transcriptional regulator [Gammaproteobacteria bacterium]MCW8972116.1 AsnC family transcriptional regulator [Gammaproteobacteria bacterium]
MDMRARNILDQPLTVALDPLDQQLIAAIQRGLPLVARPYAEVGAPLGLAEEEVVRRIEKMQRAGIIKRMGVVVRHRELGYRANAMVVWDVPDEEVAELGRCLSGFDFVTLCYRRPRHLPRWPYNLFCMIHGHDREEVLEKYRMLIARCGLEEIPRAVLFSRRRFKQRGAIYRPQSDRPKEA